MYLEHFGLKERPFSIAPDPRFLFMSGRYREALSHLIYGVQEGGGFVLLTGEVGTGKTTVCRCLLQQLPENTRLAFVLNPKLNSAELLATLCDEFNIEYPENCNSLKILTDKLSEYLLECYQKNLNAVVMIDEAQNLHSDVLEQIRLLTNLETNQKKLLQIILVGQPELQEKLAQRNLRQLAQRITARYHLQPLNLKETMAYLLHRVRIAGSKNNLFSRQAIEYLHLKTQGIPRLVNTVCDRALLAAANANKTKVDRALMIKAVNEILGEDKRLSNTEKTRGKLFKTVFISAGLAMIFILAFWLGKNWQPSPTKIQVKQVAPEQPVKIQNLSEDLKETDISVNHSKTNAPKTNNPQQTILEKLLGNHVWDTNSRRSMKALLSLWQVEYPLFLDKDACQFAFDYALKCEQQTGNWQQLREYNRPAVLKFSAGINGEFWLLLKSLQGMQATFLIDGKETNLNISQLSSLWTGEFVFVWALPPGFTTGNKLNDQGEAVVWLIENLNALDPLNENFLEKTDIFSQAVEQRLINYQQSRGITADGILGMQSILKINEDTLDNIPLLKNI